MVIGEAVLDLVEHGELGVAQQIGMPQGHDGAAQALFADALLLGGHLDPIALGKQIRHFLLAIQSALAPNLGGVRGEDRADHGVIKKFLQFGSREPGLSCTTQRLGQRAAPGRGAGDGMKPGTPVAVLVLGNIGKMEEIAEGADDAQRLIRRQRVENAFQLALGRFVAIAVELFRRLPDALHDIENLFAFLFPHRVAEQAAKNADILPQRKILVGRGRR